MSEIIIEKKKKKKKEKESIEVIETEEMILIGDYVN
jgi:hypothetical protein